MPSRKIASRKHLRYWATQDFERFSAQYEPARNIGYQILTDESLEIADDGTNDWMERQRQDYNTNVAFKASHRCAQMYAV